MTTPQENQVPEQNNSKEYNFRQLEQKYQRQLEQERSAREQAERMAQEAMSRNKPQQVEEEENDEDPYIDRKKLAKQLNKYDQQNKQYTQSEIQKGVQIALQEERKNNWLKSNPDFHEILDQYANKLADLDPDLAESILEMPNTFERQKLVYKNIKTLGLHKPPAKQSTIQEKVDSNRKGAFYQPSSIGSAPYQSQGDFSPSGQKQAYEKMKEMQARLRI